MVTLSDYVRKAGPTFFKRQYKLCVFQYRNVYSFVHVFHRCHGEDAVCTKKYERNDQRETEVQTKRVKLAFTKRKKSGIKQDVERFSQIFVKLVNYFIIDKYFIAKYIR